MREFSKYELIFMVRGLRILQMVLSGRDSNKCGELAEYIESIARITEESNDQQ